MNATSPNHAAEDVCTSIDQVLSEQQSLSAVDRFSAWHGHHHRPLLEPRYRSLIPLTAPGKGEQYAFDVDLDKCSGCKACVSACHSMNGLDEEETWRSVGLLETGSGEGARRQFVTTACHHCADPGCLNGCPVLAYDKDEVTGIVRHLDDQCMGCSYCLMTCSYEVPRYSRKRGIVRKCDMCQGRLADGEAPACVQSCPNEAIRITVVAQDKLFDRYRSEAAWSEGAANVFLPHSPNPGITVPSTQYRSLLPRADRLAPVHQDDVSPAESHSPLAGLLLFTQLSVGLQVAGALNGSRWALGTSLALGLLGLGSGFLHLGQPLRAWRAFLGWRRSWFSREVIGFGLYMPLAAVSLMLPRLAGLASLVGLLCVATSVMIYAVTDRRYWSLGATAIRFYATVAVGLSATQWLMSGSKAWAFLMAAVLFAKLIVEFAPIRSMRTLPGSVETAGVGPASEMTEIQRSGRLLLGILQPLLLWRFGTALLGGVALPAIAFLTGNLMLWGGVAVLCVVLSEACERCLFFQAVSPTTMPGGRR